MVREGYICGTVGSNSRHSRQVIICQGPRTRLTGKQVPAVNNREQYESTAVNHAKVALPALDGLIHIQVRI